mgnify:CR=1 FL=1
MFNKDKFTTMKKIIVREDGKEVEGKLVWNNRLGGWVIQGKKPKNKPNFKVRRQLFDDELIYSNEVEEYLEWIRPFETSQQRISHTYTKITKK